jgi:preprotein translocase subunit SecG
MKEILRSKYHQRLLLLAILLRVLIVPFFFHPDIRIYNFQSSFLKEGVLNIYDYLVKNRQDLPYKEEFVYFPLTHFFIGGYQMVVSPLLGEEFKGWLFGEPSDYLFRYLFFLKIPYIIFDILIGVILFHYFKEKKLKESAFIFWLFNPFSILLIYFYSNIDIIPVLFSVLAILMIKKNKGLAAGLLLAVGAGFKAYPLIFLPSLLLTKEKFPKQIFNIIVSIVLFISILLPFWNGNFIASSFSSGLTNRIFENGIDIGLSRSIPYFAILYLIGFAYLYFKNKQNHLAFFLTTPLFLMATISYHIQWILWFIPFVNLWLVKNPKNMLIVVIMLFAAILNPLLINDRFLSSGLFYPISDIFLQVSYPYVFLVKIINPIDAQNILRIIFFVIAIFIGYRSIVRKSE